jgi:hypothetical protein
MLLKIFRLNNLLAPILLVVYAVCLDIFGETPPLPPGPSFSPLLSFFPDWPRYIPNQLSKGIYAALVVVLAIVLNTVSERKTLFTFSNYLTGLCFVILAFSLPVHKGFHEATLFGLPYLAFFVATLRQPTEKDQLDHFLDLGIWLGLASFFYFPGILLVLSLPAMASLQKSREPRIWAAAFVGFIAVWLIVYAAALAADVDLFKSIQSWFQIFQEGSTHVSFSNEKLSALLVIFALLVFSVYELATFLKLKRINNRRNFKMIFTHLGIAIALVVIQWRMDHHAFFILAIPLSFIWANFVYYLPKGWWRHIILELILTALIVLSFLF